MNGGALLDLGWGGDVATLGKARKNVFLDLADIHAPRAFAQAHLPGVTRTSR
jgi:hypothetical protein